MTEPTVPADIHERLFVLDLDRCLITERAYAVLDKVVAESGMVDRQHFMQARERREASGGSFDSIAWLMGQEGFGRQEYEQLLSQYVARAKGLGHDALLAPGARSLLDRLEQQSIPHAIMTYGGRANQLAKLKAAGLENAPFIIVDHKHKAEFITAWWDKATKSFTAPLSTGVIRARTAVLVDDKATAFRDLLPEPDARGYWVRSGRLLPSQEGDVPPNVTTIGNLLEIIEHENL